MKTLLLSPLARLLLVVLMCVVVGVRFERLQVSLAVSAAFALAFVLFGRRVD
jgi:hypothetical protein